MISSVIILRVCSRRSVDRVRGQAAVESNAAAFGRVNPMRAQELAPWNIERDAGATVTLTKAHEEAVLLSSEQLKMDEVPAMSMGIYTREISYPRS